MITSGMKLIVADGVTNGAADGTAVAEEVAGGTSVVGEVADGAAIGRMEQIAGKRKIAGGCGWRPRGHRKKMNSDSLGGNY